MIVWTTQY
jgi:hypothetical protein